MNREKIIEAMAKAIKIADGERPFGLYDYSKYPDPNASPPHVVRDEKTGKGILRSHDRDEASALFDRLTEQYVATAALTALEAAIRGLADVISGKAVIVAVEPDDACIYAMRFAMREARTSGVSGQTADAVFRAEYARERAAYRAMIEARPAVTAPADQCSASAAVPGSGE